MIQNEIAQAAYQGTESVLIHVTQDIEDVMTAITIPQGLHVFLMSEPGFDEPYSIFQDTLNSRHFTVNGSLSIGDIILTRSPEFNDNVGGGIDVNGGELNLFAGGVISGNKAVSFGGGVFVCGSGTFIMYGGEINGNTSGVYDNSGDGGGVTIGSSTLYDASIFTMYGGKISGNNALANGGGVCVNYNSTFEMSGDAIISYNNAIRGGGVRVVGGTFTMYGGELSNNIVEKSGGGVYVIDYGKFNMYGGNISNNTALTISGGGVSVESGSLIMSDHSVISGNTAAQSGGGVSFILRREDCVFEMSGDAIIKGNQATKGGGMYAVVQSDLVDSTTLKMNGGVIGGSEVDDANTADVGGGVYVEIGTFEMSGDAIISGNTATQNGGGIYVDKSPFTMSDDAIISDNAAIGNGGGVYFHANDADELISFNMKGGVISSNTAGVEGGGVFLINQFSKFYMEDGVIDGNSAKYGGGVCIGTNSIFEMTGGSVISGNKANTGGGVSVLQGKFIMQGGVISDNSATGGGGGGVHVNGPSNFTMTGGMISGNTTNQNGGGIFSGDYGKLDISNNSIFTGNSASTAYDFNLCEVCLNEGVSLHHVDMYYTGDVSKIKWASTSIAGAHLLNNYDINYIGHEITPSFNLTVNKFIVEYIEDTEDFVEDTDDMTVYSPGFRVKRAEHEEDEEGTLVYFVKVASTDNTWTYDGENQGNGLWSEIPIRTDMPAVLQGLPEDMYIIEAYIEHTDRGENWNPEPNFSAEIYEGPFDDDLGWFDGELLDHNIVNLDKHKKITISNAGLANLQGAATVNYSAGADYEEWVWEEFFGSDEPDWSLYPITNATDAMSDDSYTVKSLAELVHVENFLPWNVLEWPGHHFRGWLIEEVEWDINYNGLQNVPTGIIKPGAPLYIEGATRIELTAQWGVGPAPEDPPPVDPTPEGLPPGSVPPGDSAKNEELLRVSPPIYERQAYLIGSDGMILPDNHITRAEVATIFFRLITDEQRADYWTQENPFLDVALEDWFNNAVSTMTDAGIFRGLPDGTFAPNQTITRAEMAAVIVRFMEKTEGMNLLENQFNDIAGHWAASYINAAAVNGWVQGPTGIGGLFQPDTPITRAETAAMVNRIQKRLQESIEDLLPDMLTWPDNAEPNAWYYFYIQSATNSYTYDWRGSFENWKTIIPPRNWEVLEQPDSKPDDIFG